MTISFSGLASGLDTSSWVDSLVALKRAKVTTLEENKSEIVDLKDTLNSIKSFFTTFRSMLSKVTDAKFGNATTDIFAQNLATSSAVDVLTATVTTEAKEGTYNISVEKLATATRAASNFVLENVQETATGDSLLTKLGVNIASGGSQIRVDIDGMEKGITLTQNDTINSLIEKFSSVGVNSSYNADDGIFSVEMDLNKIKDGSTNLKTALHLTQVNEGYQSNSLKYLTTETSYTSASLSTKLKDIDAANAFQGGTISISTTEGISGTITLGAEATISDFVSALNEKHIYNNFDETTGILTVISDFEITNEGGTNIKNVLGLDIGSVYSSGQVTKNLSHTSVTTTTTTATGETRLGQLGTGTTVGASDKITVVNSNNESTDIAITADTTLSELIAGLTNAGLFASIDSEGRLEISGGTISKKEGSTFDPIAAFGLETEPYTAMVTGNALQETVTVHNIATLGTRFYEDLGVKEGYLQVTDPEGTDFYLKISSGMTIGQFITSLGNLGISAELDSESGILTIQGGEFTSLTDAEVVELAGQNKITDVAANLKGTDLLESLYGSRVIPAAQTSVLSTRAKSRALTQETVETIQATGTTTLGNLGLDTNGTAEFTVRGSTVTVNVNSGTSIDGLISTLQNAGIAAELDPDTHRLSIQNATLTGGTSNLSDVLNLTTSVAGKYTTSTVLYASTTVTIDATASTKLEDYGITTSQTDLQRTVNLFQSDGTQIGTITVTSSTTLGDLQSYIEGKGLTATIVDGVFTIHDGYITNPILEESLGLRTENNSAFVLGSVMQTTVQASVTGSVSLGEVFSALGASATSQVAGGYNLSFNGEAIDVSSSTTLSDLITAIYNKGGQAMLDSTGRLHISGGTVTGSVADALGIQSYTVTSSVSATGETIKTVQTVVADSSTKLSDLGINSSSFTIKQSHGADIGTFNVDGNTTLGDVFATLRTNGIDATMSEGVISLESAEGKYITGALAESLGIANETVTDVINTTSHSTLGITHTATIVATLSSTLGQVGAITGSGQVINIFDENQVQIGTISTLTTSNTIEDMFAELARFGISGTLTDGVISLYSGEGNYATGSIMENLQIGTYNGSGNTVTIGKTVTSSSQINFTKTVTATETDKISTFTGSISDGTITVKNSTGSTVTTTVVNNETTFEELFGFLAQHGINGSIQNGYVYLGSDSGNFVEGAVLSALGISATQTTTTVTLGSQVTGSQIKHSANVAATESDKISTFASIGNGTITVKNDDGTTAGSTVITNNTTFDQLFGFLTQHGIDGDIQNGYVYLGSNSGKYVEGDALTNLSITVSTTTTTVTLGTQVTGSQITHSANVAATESDKISTFASIGNGTITVKNDDGTTAGSTVITNNTTFDQLFGFLTQHGIDGDIQNGYVYLGSNSGKYVEGDALTNLSITVSTTTTTTTLGTQVTGSQITHSADVAATESDKISAFVNLGNHTVKVMNTDGTEAGSYSVGANTTFDQLFGFLAQHGIDGDIQNGYVILSSNNGKYAVGDALTNLGVTVSSTTTTTTIGTQVTGTQIAHATEVVAVASDKISTYGSIGNGSVIVKNSDGTTAASTVITNDTTFNQLFDFLSNNGVSGYIENGYIHLDSASGKYVEGAPLTMLGVGTTVVTTTSTIGVQKTGTQLTSTESRPITEDTLLSDIGPNAGTYNDGDFIVISTNGEGFSGEDALELTSTTIGDLFDLLRSHGIDGFIDNTGRMHFTDMTDAHVYFCIESSGVGYGTGSMQSTGAYDNYLTGIGIEIQTVSANSTVGKTVTGTQQVTYTESRPITESDKLSDVFSFFSYVQLDTIDYFLTINDGTNYFNVTNSNTTLGSILDNIRAWDFDAGIDEEGRIYTRDLNNEGRTISIALSGGLSSMPGVASEINGYHIFDDTSVSETRTVGTVKTSSSAVTYNITVPASETTTMKQLGLTDSIFQQSYSHPYDLMTDMIDYGSNSTYTIGATNDLTNLMTYLQYSGANQTTKIQFNNDITLTDQLTIAANRTIIFDLQGHTLRDEGTAALFNIQANGNLKLINGYIERESTGGDFIILNNAENTNQDILEINNINFQDYSDSNTSFIKINNSGNNNTAWIKIANSYISYNNDNPSRIVDCSVGRTDPSVSKSHFNFNGDSSVYFASATQAIITEADHYLSFTFSGSRNDIVADRASYAYPNGISYHTAQSLTLDIFENDLTNITDDGTLVGRIYLTPTTTIGDIISSLHDYGIEASIDENGVLQLDSTMGRYIGSGGQSSRLGISCVKSVNDIVSTFGVEATSTSSVKITETMEANESSRLVDLIYTFDTIGASASSAFDYGSVFEIKTVADFNKLRQYVNTYNKDTTGKTFVLTANINAGNNSAIGTATTAFKGTFDGGGCTITMTQTATTDATTALGLFGYVEDAVIENINLSGNIYTGNNVFNTANSNDRYLGSAVAYAKDSNIHGINSNVSIFTSTTYASRTEKTIVGGIVGYAEYSDIRDCKYTNTIVSSLASGINNNSTGWITSGGIVGIFESSNNTIENCTTTGTVRFSGTGGGIAGEIEVGGLGAVTVKNCYNSGRVYIFNGMRSDQNKGNSGQIVGTTYATRHGCTFNFENCVSTAQSLSYNVTAANTHQGAFIGLSTKANDGYGVAVLCTNCYANNAAANSAVGYGYDLDEVVTLDSVANIRNSCAPLSSDFDTGSDESRFFANIGQGYAPTFKNDYTVISCLDTPEDEHGTFYYTDRNCYLNLSQNLANVCLTLSDEYYDDGILLEINGIDNYITSSSVLDSVLFLNEDDMVNIGGTYYAKFSIDNYKVASSAALSYETNLDDISGWSKYPVDNRSTIVSNGTEYTITSPATGTVADVLNQFAAYGIHGHIENQRIVFTPTEDCYIKSVSNNIKNAFRVSGDTYGETNETYIAVNETTRMNSVRETATMTTASTMGQLSISNSCSVVSNGTTYTITMTSDMTVDDFLTTLAGYGISGSVHDGKLSIQGTEDAYVTYLPNTFKISGNNNYTSVTETTWYGTGRSLNDVTITATSSSTLADLGYNNSTTITVNGTHGTGYITVNQNTTLNDMFTQMAGYGISAGINNGTVVIRGTNEGYISSWGGNGTTLCNALKISSTIGNYSQTVSQSYYYNTSSDALTTAQTVNKTSASTIGASGTINVTYEGGAYAITVDSNQTIGDVLTALAGFGISGSISNGIISLTGTSNGYINSINGSTLATALGFSSSTTFYTESTSTTTSNTVSPQKKHNSDGNMTSDTTFAGLGLTSNQVVSGKFHGNDFSITINTTNTVGDLMTALAGYGISTAINNGVFTIQSSTEGYITTFGDNENHLKTALGIANNASFHDNGTTTTTYSNTTSTYQHHNVTTTMSSTSTLESLGIAVNANKTISGKFHGNDFSFTVNGNNNVGDIMTTLAGYGIASSINNGTLTIQSSTEGFITTFGDDALKTALGIATNATFHDEGTTTTHHVNSTSAQQNHWVTTTMSSTSTLESLGIAVNANKTISGKFHGNDFSFTVNGSNNVGDIMTTLAGYGIASSINNGTLTIQSSTEGFITTFGDNALATALGIANNATFHDNGTTTTHHVNSTSAQQNHWVTTTMSSTSTLESLGIAVNANKTISGKFHGNDFSFTVNGSNNVGDIMTTLAGYGIASSINNGTLTIQSSTEGYITTFGDNALASALGIANNATFHDNGTTTTTYVNTTSNYQTHSVTTTLSSTNTLSELGLTENKNIVVSMNGNLCTVTVAPTDTVGDMLTKLAGYGISGGINNGQLYLSGSPNHFISSMDNDIATALKLSNSTTDLYTVKSSATWCNDNSKDLNVVNNSETLTGNSKLSSITGFSNGNGSLKIVQTNGQAVTISVDASKSLDNFFDQISVYGLQGSVDSDGKVHITGVGNTYLQNVAGGSNIITALKLSDHAENVDTFTVNRTSATQTHSTTVAAVGTTTLEKLQNAAGTKITFDGSNKAQLVVSTTSNAGNETTTLEFNKTDTIYQVIDALSALGINASIDNLGRFSLNSSTLTDLDISGSLGNFLMTASYSKQYGESNTYSLSTELFQKIVSNMDDTTLLSTFGITGGDIKITQEDSVYTVNIDTTSIQTVGDFRQLLAQYGFTTNIDERGRLVVTGIGNSRLDSILNGSNIIQKFGLTDWSRGEITQLSEHLTDTTVITDNTSLDRKLSELTRADGTSLGIHSGNIYVYQDGTRSAFHIDENETLQTLQSRLAQYGITMGLGSNGNIYFDGNNDSYLTTNGIAQNVKSNILEQLQISNDWQTRYDSTSRNLEYTETENTTMLRSTKLKNLKDSSGNDMNITEGTYYVYENGVRNTETITEDTTVGDFMAQLAYHGIIADIDESGAISVSGHNDSYLETSSFALGNSNIVNRLFSEWHFENVYTSNGIDVPQPETVAITRSTELRDINGSEAYQDGYITVIRNGVQTNISLTQSDTVGTLIDELALYGFDSVINENGQLIIRNTGDSRLQEYSGSEQKSNILKILGTENWISTYNYEGSALGVTTTSTNSVSATRNTALSELGVSVGEYDIFVDNVKYTAYISSDSTLGSLCDTLKTFGFETSIVDLGNASKLSITNLGNAYIAKSTSATNSSNVVEQLFTGDINHRNIYQKQEQIKTITTDHVNATEDTYISKIVTADLAGDIAVEINGVQNIISIDRGDETHPGDTVGTLLNKFKSLGLNAFIENGQITVQGGFNDFELIRGGLSTSNLANAATNGFQAKQTFDGYLASSETVKASVDKIVSVSQYADANTDLSLLNITKGSLSIYKNGQKTVVQIEDGWKFSDLQSAISSTGITIGYENGYLTFRGGENDDISVGATTDTSNFSSITGVQKNADGIVKSARELYCVNNESKIANTSNLFRNGTVTEGVFTVGNAVIEVNADSTLQDIISQINTSESSNATAYWDNIKGQLVIESRSTGAAFVNIEAGCSDEDILKQRVAAGQTISASNFTDIMGLTVTAKNGDGSIKTTSRTLTDGPTVNVVENTRMNVKTQEMGENAKFTINGTTYTSTSNNISSDVSKIKGTTLNLNGISEGSTVKLTIEKDKETLANAIEEVVDSYNDLMKNVDEQIAATGDLHNETTLKLIRDQLRNLMTGTNSIGTTFKNLDSIGISVAKASGGNIATSNSAIVSLSFDKDKFMKSFTADQSALKTLLIGTDSVSNNGIFTQLEKIVGSAVESTYGYFSSAQKSYDEQISKLNTKIKKANAEVERYRALLENKFKSMDMLIAQMNQQYSTFLKS